MDKLELKKHILDKLIELQIDIIKNLKVEMADAQKSANEYGPPKDRYDAFRSQLLRKRDMYGQRLQKAGELLDVLNRIPSDKLIDKVEFGAIVITNKNKIVVSIGLGKVQIDRDEYFAVSPIVPIYKAMEGKRAGEEFVFNGVKIEIVDVF